MDFRSDLIEVRPLGPAVWGVLPRPGSGATSNAGIVDTGQVTVVFDTMQTPECAKDLRSAARVLTGRDPSHVVNSHWHFDHTIGNRTFGSATIISTGRTQTLLRQRGPAFDTAIQDPAWKGAISGLRERAQRLPEGPEKEEIVTEIAFRREVADAIGLALSLPPTETFDERFRLPGDRLAVLIEGAGHSESDTALWVPSSGVLFTGDVVTVRSHPNLASGDLDRWRLALDRVRASGATTLVPGHGPISDPTACDAMLAYFDRLSEVARSGGSSAPIVEEYAAWSFPSLFRANLERVRAIRRGLS